MFSDCNWLVHIISISPWFNLGRLNFSRNLFISSRLSILLAYSCYIVFYDPLYISVVCGNLSFLIFNFVDLIFSISFLMSLANDLPSLLIFFYF